MKDLRATGQKVKTSGGPKKGRGNVRVEEGKTKYQWRNPSGTFRYVLVWFRIESPSERRKKDKRADLVGMSRRRTLRCTTRLCLMSGSCRLESQRQREGQSRFQKYSDGRLDKEMYNVQMTNAAI
jgi:hypothetical protein